MNWLFSSQQNTSQLNLKKLENFKTTKNVGEFNSFFFSEDIGFRQLRDAKTFTSMIESGNLKNKIDHMYKLLKKDYDNNINESSSSDFIINHFKLTIICSYSMFRNNNNYYICEISKSIYYCLLLLLMYSKITTNNEKIIRNVLYEYEKKHKTHLDNFTGEDSNYNKYIPYYNLIKGAIENYQNNLKTELSQKYESSYTSGWAQTIQKKRSYLGGKKNKKPVKKTTTKKPTTKKPTTKKPVKKTTTKKPTTKKPVKKTTTKKPVKKTTTKKPVKKTTTKKPIKKTTTKKPTTKKPVKKTTTKK